MTEPKPDCQEQASKEERSADMKKIREELESRARQIDGKINALEQAKLVSQETLRMEFKV